MPLMNGAALPLVVAALLGQGAGKPAAPVQEPAPVLAERAPVAGMEAILSVSTLVYEGYPDRPHELFAIYAFPDRALWHLSLIGGSASERVIEYRSGDACWRIDREQTGSRRLDAPEGHEQVLRMELRRALLLWPDGFRWESGAGPARADLGELGRLEAELGGAAQPSRMSSFDAAGALVEAFDGIAWERSGERSFPRSARLSVGGSPVWSETFQEISPGVRCLDSYFVPAERKTPRAGLVRETHGPLDLELGSRAVLSRPLEPGLDWPAALERAARVRLEVERALDGSRALAPGVEFELTPGGRPQAVVLALEAPPSGAPLPEGWIDCAAERVLEVSLTSLPTPAAGGLGAHLEALRRDLPRGSRTGTARLWLDPGANPTDRRLRIRIPVLP